jgi:hypothetical protein
MFLIKKWKTEQRQRYRGRKEMSTSTCQALRQQRGPSTAWCLTSVHWAKADALVWCSNLSTGCLNLTCLSLWPWPSASPTPAKLCHLIFVLARALCEMSWLVILFGPCRKKSYQSFKTFPSSSSKTSLSFIRYQVLFLYRKFSFVTVSCKSTYSCVRLCVCVHLLLPNCKCH